MVEWQELVEIAIGPSGGDALEGQGQPGGHNAYRIELTGESMRKHRAIAAAEPSQA